MATTQISARIDTRLKRALKAICAMKGLKINSLVTEALLDKLEELEDKEDIPTLRKDSTRPFSEVLRELGLSGKL